MNNLKAIEINPSLDLVFERKTNIKPELIWRGYTEPNLLMKWFTPSPWKTIACEIDLRPGGVFKTTMQSPEGEAFPNEGTYLEVIPNKKLVWTNAFLSDYRPVPVVDPKMGFLFSVILSLDSINGETVYKAIVRHVDEASRAQHESMGFQVGWGQAFDQLVELTKSMSSL